MTNKKTAPKRCRNIVAALLAIVATFVLVVLLMHFHCGPESECRRNLIAERYWMFVVMAAMWTIGPPLWFLFEYAFLYDKNETSIEEFRYQQQLAAALWLGVMACLAAGWTIVFV